AEPKQTASKSEAIKDKGLRIKDKGQGIKDTTPQKPPKGALSEAQEQAFEAFWAIYPKKKSKGQAKIAWGKLNPSGDVIAAIMDKLPKLKTSYDWQKEGGKYIPYPATWLNAEGWEDEVTQATETRKISKGPQPGAYQAPDPAVLQENQQQLLRLLEETEGMDL
ncbi:MAG: hypothetical protein LUD78_10890, partial [Clostridiales bacterium]|nr:hypothetical protein [Clostridiales bacterium]